MKDVNKKSLALHKKYGGKIEINGKVSVKDRNDLSLVYTPGVGQVSLEIAKNQKKVYEYTIKKNTIAVVSDGSAVLGLGNLGAKAAIPVMEGKALLFKEFAGVDAFPICLDTQDTEEIIKTVKNIAPVFGGINLEDISAPRCFEIEKRLRAELDIPVMHDDQHGTSMVVLAGLINALNVRGLKKENAKVLINGAGSAGTAISKILVNYGFKRIILCDSRGIVSESRKDLNKEKIELLEFIKSRSGGYEKIEGVLLDAIKNRDIFIGVSKAGVLTEEMVKLMNKDPIIFALANPVPEIMPDLAKKSGAFIVATGRSDFPNQLNNVLGFPGIFRGAIDNKIGQFKEEMFVQGAKNLAKCVSKPTRDNLLPKPFDRRIVKEVAKAFK